MLVGGLELGNLLPILRSHPDATHPVLLLGLWTLVHLLQILLRCSLAIDRVRIHGENTLADWAVATCLQSTRPRGPGRLRGRGVNLLRAEDGGILLIDDAHHHIAIVDELELLVVRGGLLDLRGGHVWEVSVPGQVGGAGFNFARSSVVGTTLSPSAPHMPDQRY